MTAHYIGLGKLQIHVFQSVNLLGNSGFEYFEARVVIQMQVIDFK